MPHVIKCCLSCIYEVFALQQEAVDMRKWTTGVRLCTYWFRKSPLGMHLLHPMIKIIICIVII